MVSFDGYNPIVIAVYFIAVAGIAMFCMHPVILLLSLFGAVSLFLIRNGGRGGKSHLFFLLLFLCMTLINPLVSHNGVTVLFVWNHNPITAEALLYGFLAAVMILSVLYWCRSFASVMTEDKLLYLFGRLSPKLSLTLSMALRYVSLMAEQAKKIQMAQTAMGLYREESIFSRLRGSVRVFSVLLTWSLENGIITADSMSARGYGIGKRRSFSLFRFGLGDGVLLGLVVGLSAVTCLGIGFDALQFACYPRVVFGETTALSFGAVISYGLLCFLPTLIEMEERIKWKFLRRSI